jgi:hypothetical protein
VPVERENRLPRSGRLKLEINAMMDANHISERLSSMRQEISDLRITTAIEMLQQQPLLRYANSAPFIDLPTLPP